MTLKALIFDVDGTLAETEELHRKAFNRAFAEAGLDWVWDTQLYRGLLTTTGGRERILAYAGIVGHGRVDAAALHRRKTELYNLAVAEGGIELRPGVHAVIGRARTIGLKLAIATTTSRPNVETLLATAVSTDAATWFSSIRTGEDVSAKKPDPEVYRLALRDLDVEAGDALAVEDSRNGMLAAMAAGIPVLVTPGLYTSHEAFPEAVLVLDDLSAPLPRRRSSALEAFGPILDRLFDSGPE